MLVRGEQAPGKTPTAAQKEWRRKKKGRGERECEKTPMAAQKNAKKVRDVKKKKEDLTGQGLCGRIKTKTGKGRSPEDDEETQLIFGRIGSLPSGRRICAAVKKLCQAPSPGYAGLLPCARIQVPAAFGHGSFTVGRS